MPQDCANLFSHGLRAKRLLEFAAAGISVLGVFSGLADGSASIERIQTKGDGVIFAALVDYVGQKVLIIFGAVEKPTTFALPWVEKGETMAQAMERFFGTKGKFPNPLSGEEFAKVAESLRALGGCVKTLLEKHNVDTAQSPIPEAVDQPVPVPAETPVVPDGTSNIMTNESQTFATTDSSLLNFTPEEIEILIFLGVVLVVGYVVISCITSACTGTVVLVVFA